MQCRCATGSRLHKPTGNPPPHTHHLRPLRSLPETQKTHRGVRALTECSSSSSSTHAPPAGSVRMPGRHTRNSPQLSNTCTYSKTCQCTCPPARILCCNSCAAGVTLATAINGAVNCNSNPRRTRKSQTTCWHTHTCAPQAELRSCSSKPCCAVLCQAEM